MRHSPTSTRGTPKQVISSHRKLGVGFPTSRKGEVGHQIQVALNAQRLVRQAALTDKQIVESELIRALSITARP